MSRDRPILVAGMQRSGTTMLQSMLGRHSRIAAAPELYYWLRVYLARDELGSLEDDGNLKEVTQLAVDVPLRLWDASGVTVDAVIERMRACPRRDYEALYDAILSEFAAVQGKDRWSEKSPGQHVAHSLLMSPDAQIIHIVRNVEDVVASNLKLPWRTGTPYAIGAEWRSFNTRSMTAGEAAGPDSYLQIRYEDLVRSPEDTLDRICTFLGEEFEPAMLDATPSTAVSEAGRAWQGQAEKSVTRAARRRLNRFERLQVLAAAGQTAPRFGYAPAPHRGMDALAAFASPVLRARERLRSKLAQRDSRTPANKLDTVERYIDQTRQSVERFDSRVEADTRAAAPGGFDRHPRARSA